MPQYNTIVPAIVDFISILLLVSDLNGLSLSCILIMKISKMTQNMTLYVIDIIDNTVLTDSIIVFLNVFTNSQKNLFRSSPWYNIK